MGGLGFWFVVGCSGLRRDSIGFFLFVRRESGLNYWAGAGRVRSFSIYFLGKVVGGIWGVTEEKFY